MEEHREAVNCDLMKRGYTLDDVGSALSYELDPERAQWGTIDGTNNILADIYDLLGAINYTLAYMASQKRPKKPTPYKRPGKKEKKHIGTASIPISEVKNFIFSKLRGE